jgi:hypothetical protein
MQTKNAQAAKAKLKVTFCDRTLWKNYLSVLGVVGTAVTLLSFFITANDIGINKIILAVIFIAAVVAVFLRMWYSANHQDHADLRINNTTVKVVVGDIWAQLGKDPDDRNGEVSVIGVNDFYDIIVDDRIIAASSLHGQYIKKISSAGKLNQLNSVIETDPILNKPGNRKTITSRKVGRQTRYEIGSVVEFESYVLAAFTKFDNDNKAWLTSEEYVRFWMKFWENIDGIYAGRTINIPLMGAGITRFKNGKPTKQELLEAMLWSMKISGFRNTYADKQVNFIIYQPDAQEIDFYHIQHNPIFN